MQEGIGLEACVPERADLEHALTCRDGRSRTAHFERLAIGGRRVIRNRSQMESESRRNEYAGRHAEYAAPFKPDKTNENCQRE